MLDVSKEQFKLYVSEAIDEFLKSITKEFRM